MMPIGDIISAFGIDPRKLDSVNGVNDWWIVGTPQMVDNRGGAKPGCLCVRSDVVNAKYDGADTLSVPSFLGISLEDNLLKSRYYFKQQDVETSTEGHTTHTA